MPRSGTWIAAVLALAWGGTLGAPPARGAPVEPGDLIVADSQGLGIARILQVERATGAIRTLYAAFDSLIASPRDIAIDATGHVFVSQGATPNRPAQESIAVLDVATGTAAIRSAGGLLVAVDGIALAADGAVLVADHGNRVSTLAAIVRVDPNTGAQTTVSRGGELVRPTDLVVEANGSLVVLDDGTGSGAKLVRIDPASGQQSVMTAPGTIGRAAGGIALDADGSIVVADAFGNLFRVAAATGSATPLPGGNGLTTRSLALEPDGDALLLAGGGSDRLDRIDLAAGTGRTIASGFVSPQSVAVAPSPMPFCDVETDRSAYRDGDTVRITTLRIVNPGTGSATERVRLQLWIAALPALAELVSFTAALPGRFDVDLAPFSMVAVHAGLPRGAFEFRCTLENPATNAVDYADAAAFQLQ